MLGFEKPKDCSEFTETMKSKVLFILGPTASGKSQLALDLSEHLPIEIISVDSALVYRQMDIGTAKPNKLEREQVTHHLIDICDPLESYSAGQFYQDAKQLIDEIIAREKIPVLVGGTMLYFRALLNGIADLPKSDQTIREQLTEEAKKLGWSALHKRLKEKDPKAASLIHPNDNQRIQRALEVIEITGSSLTDQWEQQRNENEFPYEAVQLALVTNERQKLHNRIQIRLEQMLKLGFVEEVAALKERGDLHPDLPSMRAVGYRQVWQYLDGIDDYQTMREKAVAATRQLAKRQLTWLRSWQNVKYLLIEEQNLLDQTLKSLI